MIRLKETLGGEPVYFHAVQNGDDLNEVFEFVEEHRALAIDTESTGINPYRRGWELRTVQIGDAYDSYVIPARWRKFIHWLTTADVKWIGHNGPHDIRSINRFLGMETGMVCHGETYIPAHHSDSRKQMDGGIGHGLKVQAQRYVAHDAGKWEDRLKAVFKTIEISIPGKTYKSGPRKGQPKMRKARLDEGWALINPAHSAYVAYAASDPILTYRLWRHYQPVIRRNLDLYHFDLRVQQACDRLNRRGFRLDEKYTERLNEALEMKANEFIVRAADLGCKNINSGMQISLTLESMGVQLRATTPTGKYRTDDKILRGLLSECSEEAADLIHCILGAKQLLKRRASYTEAFLREVDADGRVHPSINTLGARTSRMSVSDPALQQLPTKDREGDIE